MYKVETYIPKEALEKVVDAIKDYAKTESDKYIHCLSWHSVNSMWMPVNNANPYLGELGKDQYAEEYVLTFRCEEDVIRKIRELIIANHPYEVACIDVYKLESFD